MYLFSKTCEKHLPGETAAKMRIHFFLENSGFIYFKINPKFKPNFIRKFLNFKSHIYFDLNIFMFNNSQKNENIGGYNTPERTILLTNKNKCLSK